MAVGRTLGGGGAGSGGGGWWVVGGGGGWASVVGSKITSSDPLSPAGGLDTRSVIMSSTTAETPK